MNSDKVIYETRFTVGDLMDQINYTRDDDDQEITLTETQLESLARQINDVMMAVVEDFIDDLDE